MKPPSHLKPAGRALWTVIDAEYAHDGREAAILAAACEAADRVAEARAAIERDGAYVPGRYGVRAHPAIGVERDARAALVRTLAALGVERPAEAARRAAGVSSFPRGRRTA